MGDYYEHDPLPHVYDSVTSEQVHHLELYAKSILRVVKVHAIQGSLLYASPGILKHVVEAGTLVINRE